MDLYRLLMGISAAACLVWLLAIWLWPSASFVLCFDDSFYYFEIARNLGEGHGSTFDRLHPTNGYHPLWMAICVPVIAAFSEPLTAVRVLLTLQLAMWFGVLAAVVRIVSTRLDSWPRRADAVDVSHQWLGIGFGLVVVSPFLLKAFVNGMESAPYALCYAWLLVLSSECGGWFGTMSLKRKAAFVALCCTAFLCRTDAGLMFACIGLWTWYLDGFRRGFELLLAPAVVVVAFLATNQALFGIPMQVSGELKRVPPGLSGALIIAVSVGLPIMGLWFARRHFSREGHALPRLTCFFLETGWFAVFVGLTFAYYVGLQTFPRLWYFGPALLYVLLLAMMLAADLLEQARDEAEVGVSASRALMPLGLLALIPCAGGLGYQVEGAFDDNFAVIRWKNVEAARWIDANLPEDAVLGSWDAGVVGYFSDRRIVNLDGVVNSPTYAAALRTGTTGPLLDAAGIEHIVNHGSLVDGEDPEVRPAASHLWGRDLPLERVVHFPFVFHGSTNDLPPGEHEMAVFVYAMP